MTYLRLLSLLLFPLFSPLQGNDSEISLSLMTKLPTITIKVDLKDIPEEKSRLIDRYFAQTPFFVQETKGYRYLLTLKEDEFSWTIRLKEGKDEKKWRMAKGEPKEEGRSLLRLLDRVHLELSGFIGIGDSSIIYTLRKNDERSDIVSYHPLHRRIRPLIERQGYNISPCFRRDPTPLLLYVNYSKGPAKIFARGEGWRSNEPLIALRGNQLMPALSFDENSLAFIADASCEPDLFYQRFDPFQGPLGKPLQLFHRKGAVAASPSFSPDGRSLAFVSSLDGTARIYLLDLDKADATPRLVSKKAAGATAPSFAPNNNLIAFCAPKGDYRQIWIYDKTSQKEWPITQGRGHKENPSFAPDSFHLVYNQIDEGKSELFIIDLYRKEPHPIHGGEGEKCYPQWIASSEPEIDLALDSHK